MNGSDGTVSREKRSRLVTGCQGCRERHLKCRRYMLNHDYKLILYKGDTNTPSCLRCITANIECVRSVNVRFKKFNDGNKELDLTFPEDQTWTESGNITQFYNETQDLIRYYQGKDVSPLNNFLDIHSRVLSISGCYVDNDRAHSKDCTDHELVPQQEQYTVPMSEDVNLSGEPGSGFSAYRDHSEQSTTQASTPISIGILSPAVVGPNDGIESIDNQNMIITLTDREAVLMRNFIEKMALWADISDMQRHFETEVPRRALYQPVLRFAIFAFSSRHINRSTNDDSTESLQYHNKCLQLLIPKLSELNEEINEDILAAIAILRQYEEMDDYDSRCHLIGTTKLLNSISTFGSSGGLGEAAAWLCLRQDIYVSLVSQQPLRMHLENFHNSKTFRNNDDVSWANKMVFLLAKILSYAFSIDQEYNTTHLHEVSYEVDEWSRLKPPTFNPIRFLPQNKQDKRAFPEIWLLSPFHVIALQYYHIAKVVLAVSVQQPKVSGYENLRHGRRIEKIVHDNLLIILGLALSNSAAENTLFTARHALSVWGGVFRDTLEREATLSFLITMENRTGWKAGELINTLKKQWDEDIDM
ncbi:hypothetical protein B7463_g5911, partial [Scytalidium lignicola]